MNKGDTYTNTCDGQSSTWTITHLEGGMVTVYSPQSDRSYTIDKRIFEDTMKALGFELVEEKPAKYLVRYLSLDFEIKGNVTLEQALENGLMLPLAFQIELGEMVCATYSDISGLRFTDEYKSWYQDQQSMLAKMEGSYP